MDIEIVYIQEDLLYLFKTFRMLSSYFTENGINVQLLLRIIDEDKLDFKETVSSIPFIYQGYDSIVNPPREESKNG